MARARAPKRPEGLVTTVLTAQDLPRARVTTKVRSPKAPLTRQEQRQRMGWGVGGQPGDVPFRMGPSAFRDANPGLFAHGGNIFLSPRLETATRETDIPTRNIAVANARHVDRNNQFINSGITKRAVNTVGANLQLQYMPNWSALGIDGSSEEATDFVQAIENHFSLWGESFRFLCDAHRQAQFGAMMLTSAREAYGAEGETFVYSRYSEKRMRRYRGKYATFLELINPVRLSTPKGKPSLMDGRQRDGTDIVAGKVLDEWGAAMGFWIKDETPADNISDQSWTYIPRETKWGRPVGIHWFSRARSGAQRNMPAIIASLRNVKMLDRFDDATLQTAVINAILSVFVESEATPAEMLEKLTAQTPKGGQSIIESLWDRRFQYYEDPDNQLTTDDGVRIPILPPGDKINMQTADRASHNTSTFRAAFMRGFAAQLNLSYEMFSGDYSETTFSSARAAMIDIWRLITVDRILFTQHVAGPIFLALLEEFYLRADELDIPWPDSWPDFYDNMDAWSQCEFRGPGMGWVDPEKDVNAAGKRQEQALTSPTFEAAQQGQSFTDNIDAIARDHAYARKKKVIIPGMPEWHAIMNPTPVPAGGGGDGGDTAPADDGREGRPRGDK